MADDAQEHEHGTMDITVQEETFEGFMNFTVKTVIGILIFLVFLALIGT